MKVEDFEKVQKLVNLASCLRKSYAQLIQQSVKYAEKDCGGVDDITSGYSIVLSKFRDGSGAQIDLSGCYVGTMVVESTKGILENQFERVKTALSELGVSADGMEITGEK